MTEKSTVRTREMAAELKAQRELKHLTLRELARRADWSASRVSAWENGRRIAPIDAATYLAHCGTKAPERARLLELTRPPGDQYWVRPYFDDLVDPARSLLVQENLASGIAYYSPAAVPGMLQTEDYVRTCFELTGSYTEERLAALTRARVDRQRLLQRRDPPSCTFFVHERALRSVVGGPDLMHEQVQNLVLAANLPHCTIRMVPDSAAAFRVLSTTFTVLEFPDHPPIAYEETFTAGLFVDNRTAVEAFHTLMTRLDEEALPKHPSLDYLVTLATEYERLHEPPVPHPTSAFTKR